MLNPAPEGVARDYPSGGQFPIWLIKLAIELVLDAGVSLRAVPRVLQLVGRLLGQVLVVDWSSVRCWLLRLGCHALRGPFEPALDVAYLIDFSIQLGTCKCLVIVAVRLGEVPYPDAYPAGVCVMGICRSLRSCRWRKRRAWWFMRNWTRPRHGPARHA